MKFKNKIIVVCLCVSVFAGGCGQGGQNTTKSKNSEGTASSKESTERTSQDNEASKDIFAMDTYMTVTAYGENAEAAVDAAQAEIERLDALLSTGDADSEIAKLNAFIADILGCSRAFRRCRLSDGTCIGTLSGDRWRV